MRRGQQWFEKIIRCMILLTGFYILYRGSGILAETGFLSRVFQSDKAAETMREAAVNTYLPGYDAALNGKNQDGVVERWVKEFFPALEVWSEQAEEETEGTGIFLTEPESEAAEENLTEGESDGGKAGTERAESGAAEEKLAEGESDSGKAGTEGPESETAEEKLTEGESDIGNAGTEEAENGAEEKMMTEGESNSGRAGTEESESSAAEERLTEGESDSGRAGTGETENSAAVTETEEPESAAAETPAEPEPETEAALPVSMDQLLDFDYLLNHYFVVDSDTVADAAQLDAQALLAEDFRIEKDDRYPQILIYHTHSQEAFVDSVEGDTDTTIIGIGDYLASLLEERYGYQVIHDTGVYDLVDGVLDRSAAYDYARVSVEKILEENPTIQVIIDLHRDGVEGVHFVTDVNGKPAAKLMFFNGLSRNSAGQPIEYLPNPYTEENLAFSFQLQLEAERDYPGLMRSIYLKGQRFNLHLRPRSLLIEAGSQLNTVEEEKNAMEPLADILNQILSGDRS